MSTLSFLGGERGKRKNMKEQKGREEKKEVAE